MSLKIALERIQNAKKSNAKELDLSTLELIEIPSEISKLPQITQLSLADNFLTEIKGLDALTQLTSIRLAGNQLTEIKGLDALTQLTSLFLSHNFLSEIKGLDALTQLNWLDLGNNQLTEIKGMDVLTQLTWLNLSYNQITEIKGLDALKQLTQLELGSNQLTELIGLDSLTQLTRLFLGNNQLAEIKGLDMLTQLTWLNLSDNQITEIKGLDALKQLTQLELVSNQLTELLGLDSLTQLTHLNLGNNKLTEIKGLNALIQLTDLFLWNNQLTEIKGLDTLTKLNQLSLVGNQLTEIQGLDALTKLDRLFLGNNQLTEIKGLDTLTQLTQLSLQRNLLTKIKGLDAIKKLKLLDLRDNQLTEIQEFLLEFGIPIFLEFALFESGIFVDGNPIENPPVEVIKNGNDAIGEYFVQRKKSGEEFLNEAKLILLGDGRSGKTSLANRLLGKELPKEGDRTTGVDIEIGAYSFKLANGKDFKINIWDFAGQDKYKTLHQLFYTESSLYIMVAESGNNTTDFDDWFQTAALFGEGSPLLLILNEFKTGIGMGSFDTNYWKRQFPDLLKEVFTVNLGTKHNFSNAEEYIRLLAQTLPHTKYVFPSNWAAIRRVLNERRNEQYITLKEYLQICKNNNLQERDSALILSSVLHKVGDCLHYQKNELLEQFIILKNEWATDAVYKILDDEIVAEQKCGFFDRSDIKRIWNSAEYQDMRPQLLELIKQFKLAYQLFGKEEYVTPPLLPPGRPENFVWPDLDSLELYIEYEFLPKALLTQFIVTRHADIAEGRTLVWRHGVVLKWEDDTLAEVNKTKLQGRDAFYIQTQGNNRKGMMTVILKTFRELHEGYKGIKYKEKVPCTCEGCRTGKNNAHYFDFDNLQRRLEKGRHKVECDKSLDEVNVLALLENTFVFEKFKEGQALQLKTNVVRENTPEIRLLNLFLASSNELLPEREKIEQALNRKNKLLRKQGFLIELLIWEDGKHIGKSLRSQDNYNLEIEQCNLFALLFYSKVGKYSLEEFNLAKSLFEKGKMPRICVFQKDIDLPKNPSRADSDSRFEFLDRLKENQHFPILFENTDMLVNQLEDVIDKLIHDKSFVEQLSIE
ncbi:leucine-rich repeat domain-containing protein [Aquiflexum sp. TKW24L]|uniref:leucine-rich repeat domain-containing protein n=1 Tax=Aquiflexum sp. TKW24L TaxID=2942212 RepID=UPI0020BEAB6F|nr:COR domain-containing protein [Aquiflexum sp. TKW24L]MCL6258945.1 leucine-rich repeat domain-containing protein [Aquiflexum sp. TKW24L]